MASRNTPHKLHTNILYIMSTSPYVLCGCLLVSDGGSEQGITGSNDLVPLLATVGTCRFKIETISAKVAPQKKLQRD